MAAVLPKAEVERLRPMARRWRERGVSHRAIGNLLGISMSTVSNWTDDIEAPKNRHPRRVGWHKGLGGYCIWFYDTKIGGRDDRDPQRNVEWWPEEWRVWTTRELAQAYLEKHGDYAEAA